MGYIINVPAFTTNSKQLHYNNSVLQLKTSEKETKSFMKWVSID